MKNRSDIGRIFFGISMAVLGVLTIYQRDFPYMMIPPKHSWIPGLAGLASVFGILLVVAGASIAFGKKARPISLSLGALLLLIFCFYFIPYQLFVSSTHLVFGDWENAAKELSLASGALVMAGCFSRKDETPYLNFLSKLISIGTILFSITIISYGIDHFLYASEAADYVPAWVPYHLFWMYFTGTALLGSGFAIILKIKVGMIASLLGAMIFSWVVMLHIPRIIVSASIYLSSEITSACLALAYGGVAFVIAGLANK